MSAGLLTLPATNGADLPVALRDRYSPAETEALLLIPQVIDLVACVLGNQPQWDDDDLDVIIFHALAGRKPAAPEATLLRAIFISCVDHTPATPSSLSAITSYSGGNSLKTALAAGITAMGDTHAGAGEGTARLLTEFMTAMREADGRPRRLRDQRRAGQGPQGPGRLHRRQDHRRLRRRRRAASPATATATTASTAATRGRQPCWRSPALWAWPATTATWPPRSKPILKRQKSSGLCFNVDGVIGALLCDLHIPPAAGKASFIIPRTVGILGQLLEQDPGAFFRLSNASIIYVGPEPRQ